MALVKLSRKGVLSVSYDSLSLSDEEGSILLAYAEDFVTAYSNDKPVLEYDQVTDVMSLVGLGHSETFKDDIVKSILSKKGVVRHFSITVGGVKKTLKTTVSDDSVIRSRLRSILGTDDFSVENKLLASTFVFKRLKKVIDFSTLGENTPVMQGV